MRGSSWRLLAVLALAAALRLIAARVVGEAHVPWAYEHEAIAENVVTRGVYAFSFYDLSQTKPTSFQPPVYPLFLAATMAADPEGSFALKALQILVATLSVWMLFKLVKAIGWPSEVGLLAAFMMAVYPPLVGYAVLSSPVTLETLFLLAAMLLVFEARNRNSPWYAIGAGICLGLSSMTRSPWILSVPLVMAWLAWNSADGGRRRFLLPIILGAAALATMLPWGLRNARIHGSFSLAGTNGGLNFWIGNNPQATGEYVFPSSLDRDLVLQAAGLPEPERDRFFYRQGLEFIRREPEKALELAARKLGYFLLFRPSMGSSYAQADLPVDLARSLYQLSWLILLPVAILGLALNRMRWKDHLLLLSIFASQALVAAAFFAGTRFRTPLEPFFLIWAAAALLHFSRPILARFYRAAGHA